MTKNFERIHMMSKVHIAFNDSLDPKEVVGIIYVNAVEAGRIQIKQENWIEFKAECMAYGISFGWAFN